MPAATQFQEERAELEAVLESGALGRAPSLSQFLRYVCERYFAGAANQIKEYSIAVEALGRSADFDQKRDSIVRVEAHRLRKRLKHFYEHEGAEHEIQIEIPPGQYAPKFLSRAIVKPEECLPAATVGELTSAADSPVVFSLRLFPQTTLTLPRVSPDQVKRGWRWPLVVWPVLFLVSAAMLWVSLRKPLTETASVADPLPADVDAAIRILCGSTVSRHVDRFGRVWQGDHFFQGGDAMPTRAPRILQAPDQALFQTQRQASFGYDIPLKPGTYELHLLFAETWFGEGTDIGGGETSRVFAIQANGKPLVSELDVLSEAGGANIAEEKVYKDLSPAPDGRLHLRFEGFAFVNAIEILPTVPGRSRPLRFVSRDVSYTDSHQHIWSPDRYVSGGRLVERRDPVNNTPEPELYRGERFGHFTYTIPVAKGRYRVTMKFAETWFGPDRAGGGGVGSRLFDVYANGIVLLRNFDVFKEAGGCYRALDKTFTHLEPNAQGKLILTFTPVRNYACLNALEVVEE